MNCINDISCILFIRNVHVQMQMSHSCEDLSLCDKEDGKCRPKSLTEQLHITTTLYASSPSPTRSLLAGKVRKISKNRDFLKNLHDFLKSNVFRLLNNKLYQVPCLVRLDDLIEEV